MFLRPILFLCLCASTQSGFAGNKIDHITLQGNLKTRAAIIEQEMPLVVGDEITQSAMEQSRQAIMDLGLFEKVEIHKETNDDTTQLVVTVKEKKHDWYILPRLDRNGEGDITLGLNWRENNLNGLNQRLRFTLSHKKFNDAKKDEEIRVSSKFIYPRIINTQFSAYLYANISQVGIETRRDIGTGEYLRDEYTAGLGLGHWFARSGASKGLHADLGLEYSQFEHKHVSGKTGFYDDFSILSLIANLDYTQVKDFQFSREGFKAGIRWQQGSKRFGSDRDFQYKQLYYQGFHLLPFRQHTNVNFQVQLGAGDHALFDDPIYELSGNASLRGYPRESLQGDAFALLNSEFLTPLFGKKNVRGVLLFDAGNVYPSFSNIKDLDFEYSLGLGVRWKFKQWVNAELRIDVARGLGDEGITRVYVASEATF